jgi:hypothetical protein
MIIHVQFGFSQFISFREEDLWNFSQSEHILCACCQIICHQYIFSSVLWCSLCLDSHLFLVHLDQRSMWTIAITWRPSSVNFSHFKLLLRNHWADDQSVHITHTYCCVSKLSKFGAYLYSRVHNNTCLSLRNSP